MKRFREHVAIAIDGGGIKGLVVACALEILEDHLGRSLHDSFRLTAGTSTGSIIAASIAAGLTGETVKELYVQHGPEIFRKSWRTRLWPLTRYRYPLEPLEAALKEHVGGRTMGDFWSADPSTDVVVTAFDLAENRTRFIKPWKDEYKDWPVVTVVLGSCGVPAYFTVVEGPDERYYMDGGVGGYSNPCFLAAYELAYCLRWDPAETTLISLGTGRAPHELADADRLWPWQWLTPLLDAFLQSADDHQVHLVTTFFETLDFRRFQVDLDEPIEMDDASEEALDLLVSYGEELGRKILNDETDPVQGIQQPFRAI
jgi:hypothetical protein